MGGEEGLREMQRKKDSEKENKETVLIHIMFLWKPKVGWISC